MSDGRHTGQVVIKADAKSADRGLNELSKTNKQLNAQVDQLSTALGKAEKANERMAGSTSRLARAQKEAAKIAAAQQSAINGTAAASAQKTVDQARRARELAFSSNKTTLTQRLEAIKREETARLHQVSVEMKAARSVAESYALQSKAQEVTHQAFMQRQRAEMMAAKLSADAQTRELARVERAKTAALARSGRSTSFPGGGEGGGLGGLGTLARVGGVAGGVLAGGVIAGAAAVEVADLANESLRLQGVFNNLPYSLNQARAATKGFADDLTLATLAVQAQQTGVAMTAEAYADITGKAQTLALKVGRDVPDTLSRVIQGIGKQERELFDELGLIIPHQDQINKALAESLNKTTSELTTQERAGAFLAEVMKALDKATTGVTVSTDGAAAAIARTTVKVKNLRTAALGGVEAQKSLADGVQSLDLKILRQVSEMGTYRNAFYQVSAALEDAGVSTTEYANDATGLQQDIEKLLKSEARRLVGLADQKKLTEEDAQRAEELLSINGVLSEVNEKILRKDLKRLGAIKEQSQAQIEASAASKKAKQDELLEIENQLAFGKAAKISQEQLNALVQEEARLRAELLDLEGETTKAAELRREAELAAFEAAGASVAPKKGGGKGRSRKDAARELAEAQADARIAADERVRDTVTRSLEHERASYEDLRVAVLAVQAAERMRAQLELEHAKGKAETLRAETALLDLRAQQSAELADLAEQEAQAERDRSAALWEGTQASQARAQAELRRRHELEAAAPNRAAAPRRRTLAQGLGIDAGPMSQESAQAQMDMGAERARNAELRALRQAQLDEERAYNQIRAADEATRVEATAELRRIDDEQSQLYHEAQLDRLRELQWAENEAFAREQERLATRKQLLADATSFGLSQAESTIKSALSIAKTERAARRAAMDAARKDGKSQAEIAQAGADAARTARGNALIALGEELQGQAISYTFKAIAAGVALDPVGAATNAAAAAVMYGGAAAVKARGRTLAGSGASDSGGDAGAPAGGDGPATNPLAGGRSANDFPGSRRPPSAGNPAGGSDAAPTVINAGGTERTINLNFNAPLVDPKTVREIRDSIDQLGFEG